MLIPVAGPFHGGVNWPGYLFDNQFEAGCIVGCSDFDFFSNFEV